MFSAASTWPPPAAEPAAAPADAVAFSGDQLVHEVIGMVLCALADSVRFSSSLEEKNSSYRHAVAFCTRLLVQSHQAFVCAWLSDNIRTYADWISNFPPPSLCAAVLCGLGSGESVGNVGAGNERQSYASAAAPSVAPELSPVLAMEPGTLPPLLSVQFLHQYVTVWSKRLSTLTTVKDVVTVLTGLGVVLERHCPRDDVLAVINTLLRQFVGAISDKVADVARYSRVTVCSAALVLYLFIVCLFVCFIASQLHATAVIRYTHRHTQKHHIHTIPSDRGSLFFGLCRDGDGGTCDCVTV